MNRGREPHARLAQTRERLVAPEPERADVELDEVRLHLREVDRETGSVPSLREATGARMAYSLSVQLAAMKLNVLNGKVDGARLIYSPGATSANAAGFAAVNAVTAEADAELGQHGLTNSGSAFRAYQSALSDALLNANEKSTFVQASPCAFSFR